MTKLKIFDAFCGIGGIRLGFELASEKFETVYAVDFNEKCKDTYDLNFKTAKLNVINIEKINIDELIDFDIITAGFPCQPFSIAGKQLGLADERGQIIYKLLKIIKIKKPQIIFLENVKNFKTFDSGNVYNFINTKLKKYGYFIKDEILNTCEYSEIPQGRERIYIVGFLDENIYNNFNFPKKVNCKKSINDFLESDIDKKYYYTEKSAIYEKLIDVVNKENTVYQYRRHYVRENKNNNVPTLTANMGTGGHNVPIICDNEKPRKLTPKECLNFQGFPKSYKLGNIADSHLYKQAGNSVTVLIIKKIAQSISLSIDINNNDKKYTKTMKSLLHKIQKYKIHGTDVLIDCIKFDKSHYIQLLSYYKCYIKMNDSLHELYGRRANISEAFTEGLYCYLTNSVRVLKIHKSKTSSSIDCWNNELKKSIQIKASVLEHDCSSFGPDSVFDTLVYIDLSDLPNFKIYEIESDCIGKLILNNKKNETFDMQCEAGKRPRFSIVKSLINVYKTKPFYTGNINDIEKNYNNVFHNVDDFICEKDKSDGSDKYDKYDESDKSNKKDKKDKSNKKDKKDK
jgi:DNA (cytosine-5)-methyltransferase 1